MSFEQEAMREYAREVGRQFPERAWISTPLDSWERNPFYTGPEVPHPEADDGDYSDDGQGPREDYSTGGGECDDNPGCDEADFHQLNDDGTDKPRRSWSAHDDDIPF